MTEVIGVRFRGGCKEYYFDPHGIAVEAGQFVIVETAQGTEYAQCLTGNHEVDDGAVVRPLRALVRIATENDRRTMEYNRQREKDAFGICQRKIAERGLDMKLVRVECSFDGSKIVFFFTSEGRVDFRELVRDLAGVFRARIELRQIGVRDEAKMLGGLGICGRPFCCAQFLDDFVPVSIKMAKTQNLSLNPTKISGACGRLMCCLKYEQAAYEDAVKRMPKNDSFVLTPDGPGNVSAVNLVRETVSVRLDDSSEGQKSYHGCEIRVLRNGKGSREGIEIPAERPARFVSRTRRASWMPFPRPCSARWSSPSPMLPLCRKRLPPRRAVRSVSAVAAGDADAGAAADAVERAAPKQSRRPPRAAARKSVPKGTRKGPPTRAASAVDRPSAGRARRSLLSPLPKGSPLRAARVKRARAAGIIAAGADAGAAAAEAAAEHRAQRRARNKVKKREPLFPAVLVFSWVFRAERV